MNPANSEDSESRKREPQSFQSDETFEENSMKVSLSKHEANTSRKTEPQSLQSDETFEENSMKVSLSKHEANTSRKTEPQSLLSDETFEENSMKVSLSKHEANTSRKTEPQSLQSDETFEENSMKVSLSKHEANTSRKTEPQSLQSDETFEENSMKVSLSKHEANTSRKTEPRSVLSDETSQENTIKVNSEMHTAKETRKSAPISLNSESISEKKMSSNVHVEDANEVHVEDVDEVHVEDVDEVERPRLRARYTRFSHLSRGNTIIPEPDQQEEEKNNAKEHLSRERQETEIAPQEDKISPGINTIIPEPDKNNAKENLNRERQETEVASQKTISHRLKLEDAMKKLSAIHTNDYMANSYLIMQQLHEESENEEDLSLKWIRFLDAAAHKYEDFHSDGEGDREAFIHQMEELVLQILFLGHLDTITTAAIDWRIAKKILSLPSLFPQISPTIYDNGILTAFGNEVDKALTQIIWLPSTTLSNLAKETLRTLQKCFSRRSRHEILKQAVIVGRFDKVKFGLSNSLILGEDGGLYLLLNRLTKEQQNDMVKQNIVTEDYLKDKIIKSPEDKDEIGDKVVLGKGGFGTVKFALSLFRSKAGCGDVICIKKTRSFEALASRKAQNTLTPLQVATEAIMEDYFASDVADKVYAPQIFDLAIVSDSAANKKSELLNKGCHQKAYLMMEVFPQNTATKIFKEAKHQKWKYQKPYLQEVLLATWELLKNGIAFTDLKPANTLFDPETFKTTIIDLGGSIKLDADSLNNFDKTIYSCQLTKGYCAPEMIDDERIIVNISKALAYTCGKVIEVVVQNSDYNQQGIQELIDKLTNPESDQRISIEEASECLKNIGDDTNCEETLLEQYISKIQSRIEHNRSSISLNEDILITKELYIDLKVTHRDPEKYKDQETDSLFERIEHFLAVDQDQQQVMAIFGHAGSGKSIALQLKFIEAAQKWSKGQPLPIYFNLANGVHLKKFIYSMNAELGTNLKLQELKNDVHLYIDSFDEGLEIEKKRETLVQNYIAEFKNSRAKILITCRSDYLESETSYNWFTPQVSSFRQLATFYVAPLSYIGAKKIEKNKYSWEEKKEKEPRKQDSADGSRWKKNFATYLEYNNTKKKDSKLNIEETLDKMAIMNLDKLIDTGLMFKIVMDVLPDLLKGGNQSRSRSKQDVYLKYVTKYQKEELEKLTKEQQTQVTECIKFISESKEKEFTLIEAVSDLGKYLAVQLHLRDKFKLDQDAPIFKALMYEDQIHFKKQVLWHALKLLPLKIETKQVYKRRKTKTQEVKLGFIHDTIKNSYLLDAIQDEMSTQNGRSQILSSKNIVADNELVKFIADAAFHNAKLKTYLRQAIDVTKSDKSESAAICAANCITILVSAHYSFSGQDLSKVNIKGSNLSNGIFSGVNFYRADLSYTTLRNAQVNDATIRKANLIGVQLGILPNLVGHKDKVNGVSFSSDGKYVASGSDDQTVKIWEVQTNKCLATLRGSNPALQNRVNSVSFSSDGNYVVASSNDNTINIWEMKTNKCLATLQGHTRGVNGVSFSSDGKYVASGSDDQTVKIWDVQTNQCLVTLQDHTSSVESVSFSSDGKYLASGASDSTVKIWEMQTNNCLSTLQDHTSGVNGVNFSSDGKYVASGSQDQTVKIWEVQTKICLATLKGHNSDVRCVSFSSDGMYLASGSYDKLVKIWEVQTNKCWATLQGHTKGVSSVSFSCDGKYVASGSDDQTVKIWEMLDSTSKLIEIGSHTNSVRGVSFSSDGKYVASGSNDHTIKIWEVQTKICFATLQGHTDNVNDVSFSSDGNYVASGSEDQTVKIWDVQTNKCLATLKGHTRGVYGVSFSRDGKYVASGSEDQTVRIWEVQMNKCLATLKGNNEGFRKHRVNSVSFSRDGKYVASGSEDHTVKIWDVQTNKCFATLQGHTDDVNGVSFSSDGKYVASGSDDQTVKIWEVQTKICFATLQGHTDNVNDVSLSSDGMYLASGSHDNTVKIWEVQTNKCLATLKGHTNGVNSVSFSPDGKYVASGSEDHSVKIWFKNINSWLLESHLSYTELPLKMQGTLIRKSVISVRNHLIFEQHEAKTQKNKIADNTAIITENSSTLALYIVEKQNERLLTMQIATYKELARQNAVQVYFATLLKQVEQNKKDKNEGTEQQIIADKETVVVNRSQSADPSFPHSSTIEVLKEAEQNEEDKSEGTEHQIIADKETIAVNQSQSADPSSPHSSTIEVKSHNSETQVPSQQSTEDLQGPQLQSKVKQTSLFGKALRTFGIGKKAEQNKKDKTKAIEHQIIADKETDVVVNQFQSSVIEVLKKIELHKEDKTEDIELQIKTDKETVVVVNQFQSADPSFPHSSVIEVLKEVEQNEEDKSEGTEHQIIADKETVVVVNHFQSADPSSPHSSTVEVKLHNSETQVPSQQSTEDLQGPQLQSKVKQTSLFGKALRTFGIGKKAEQNKKDKNKAIIEHQIIADKETDVVVNQFQSSVIEVLKKIELHKEDKTEDIELQIKTDKETVVVVNQFQSADPSFPHSSVIEVLKEVEQNEEDKSEGTEHQIIADKETVVVVNQFQSADPSSPHSSTIEVKSHNSETQVPSQQSTEDLQGPQLQSKVKQTSLFGKALRTFGIGKKAEQNKKDKTKAIEHQIIADKETDVVVNQFQSSVIEVLKKIELHKEDKTEDIELQIKTDKETVVVVNQFQSADPSFPHSSAIEVLKEVEQNEEDKSEGTEHQIIADKETVVVVNQFQSADPSSPHSSTIEVKSHNIETQVPSQQSTEDLQGPQLQSKVKQTSLFGKALRTFGIGKKAEQNKKDKTKAIEHQIIADKETDVVVNQFQSSVIEVLKKIELHKEDKTEDIELQIKTDKETVVVVNQFQSADPSFPHSSAIEVLKEVEQNEEDKSEGTEHQIIADKETVVVVNHFQSADPSSPHSSTVEVKLHNSETQVPSQQSTEDLQGPQLQSKVKQTSLFGKALRTFGIGKKAEQNKKDKTKAIEHQIIADKETDVVVNQFQSSVIEVLKKIEQHKEDKTEDIELQIKTDKETVVVVNQFQSADPSFPHSSAIEVKLHNSETQAPSQQSAEDLQGPQLQSVDKQTILFSNRIYKAYGDALRKRKQYGEAIQAYDVGLRVLSEEASPHSTDKAALLNGKGLALLASTNQFDEAIKCFDKAIKCFDQAIEATALNALALYHCNKGKALYEKNPKDIAFLNCFDEAFMLTQNENLRAEGMTRNPIRLNETLGRFLKELDRLREISLTKEDSVLAHRERNYVKETIAGLSELKVVRDGQQLIDTKTKLAKVLDDPNLSEFYDSFLSTLWHIYSTAVKIHGGIFSVNTGLSAEDDAKLLVSLIPLVRNMISEEAGLFQDYVETDQVKMVAGNVTNFATNLQEFIAIAQDAAVIIITTKQDKILSLKGEIPQMMSVWKTQFDKALEKGFGRSKQIEKYIYDDWLKTPMQKLGYQIAADIVAKFIANGQVNKGKSATSLSENLDEKIKRLTNAGLAFLDQETAKNSLCQIF